MFESAISTDAGRTWGTDSGRAVPLLELVASTPLVSLRGRHRLRTLPALAEGRTGLSRTLDPALEAGTVELDAAAVAPVDAVG